MKSLLIYGLGNLLSAFFNFLSITFLASVLTFAEYGVFSLIQSASIIIYNVFLLWIVQCLIPYSGKNVSDEYKALVFNLFVFISIILFTLLVLIGLLSGNGFTFLLIACYAVSEGIAWLSLEYSKFDVKDRQYVSQNIIRAMLLLSQLVGYYAVTGHIDANISIVAFIIANVIPSVFLILARHKFYKQCPKISFHSVWTFLQEIRGFAAQSILTFGLRSVMERADRYIIDIFLGKTATGFYSVIVDLMRRVSSVIGTGINAYFYARVSKSFREEDYAGYNSLLRLCRKVLIISCLLFMGGISGLLFIIYILNIRLKGMYVDTQVVFLVLVNALSAFVFAYVLYYYNIIITLNKQMQLWIKSYGHAAWCSLILNLALIKFMGISGASLAYLISVCVLLLIQKKFINNYKLNQA